MQALEIGQLRLVTRFHQGLEACLHEFAQAAAEHRLLAEQVGFRFFLEVGFEDAGAGAADRLGIGHRQGAGIAGGVLLDGEQAGHALAVLVFPAHGVTGTLRGDHHHVHIGGGLDQAEADVEAVGEAQHLAGAQVRRNLGVVDGLLELIGQQHHDPIGLGGRIGHAQHLESVGLGLGG